MDWHWASTKPNPLGFVWHRLNYQNSNLKQQEFVLQKCNFQLLLKYHESQKNGKYQQSDLILISLIRLEDHQK